MGIAALYRCASLLRRRPKSVRDRHDNPPPCPGRAGECIRLTSPKFGRFVDGDVRADRAAAAARLLLNEFAAAPTWKIRPRSRSFLDRAEISIAVALAYDWLQPLLSVPEREAIESALRRHILLPALRDYNDMALDGPRGRDNCTFASNTGVVIAALALLRCDRALATRLLQQALISAWRAFDAFYPDGAWPEGPSYWSLTVRHASLMVAVLESSLGSDFGFATRPGFSRTGDFVLHTRGSSGKAFNFADSIEAFDIAPLAWFAHRFGRASDGWLVRDYDGWHLPFALIWGDRPAAAPASSGVSTAKVFRATALACFRNTWSSAPAARPVSLAIKGGNESELEPRSGPAYRHAQLDAGSFVVDGARTRWVVDLGGDEYD